MRLHLKLIALGKILFVLSCLILAGVAIGADDPVVRAELRPDSNLELSWHTLAGHTYRVEFKTDLNATNWFTLPGDVTEVCFDGFSGPRLLLTTNCSQRFFRVVDVTDTVLAPSGFQGVDGKWHFYYEFSVGLTASYTNSIFVTRSGFALQAGKVFDGRFDGDALADHFLILSELLADERVAFAYPVYSDSDFSTRIRISNALIVKPYNLAEDLTQLFANEHLGNARYLGFGLFVVTLLRKEDDPFVISQHLENDPRIDYAEVSVSGQRNYPCP